MINLYVLLFSGLLMYYDGMVTLVPENMRTNNLNKFYSALYMTLIMTIPMLMIGQHVNWWYVAGVIVVALFIRKQLIIQQYMVDDKDFARGMIEHHQIAIEMSQKFVEKNLGGDMTQLAHSIIDSQSKEIQQMKTYLTK